MDLAQKWKFVCYLYHLKIRIQMRSYTTPPKANSNRVIATAMPREGDWICYNCHNLNFAFRKLCNRCKTQTRELNAQLPGLYFHYNLRSFDGLPMHDITNRKFSCEMTPPKNKSQDPQKQDYKSLKLPSVSPLVKKYKSDQQSKMHSKIENHLNWECEWDIIESTTVQSWDAEFNSSDLDDEIQQMVTRIIL